MPPLEGASKRTYQKFSDEKCGYLHIDFKILQTIDKVRGYLFVAIDRATRHGIIRQLRARDAKVTASALREVINEFDHPIHTILTDNDGAFTDKYAVHKIGKQKGQPSGRHPFDLVCQEYGIKHRLIRPRHPQTNGMVERFKRRLSEGLATVEKCHKTHSGHYRRFANVQARKIVR